VLGIRAEAGVSPGVAHMLEALLTEDLARTGKLDVTSSSELAVLIGVERQKQLMSCADEGCIVEISSALGTDQLFDGSVGAIGNLRVLSLRILDVKTGKALARESATVDDEGKLPDALHELVARMLHLSAPPKPRSKVPAFISLGVGAALAIGGAVLGVVALGPYYTYRVAPASATRENLHQSAQLTAGIADGLYAAALAAAVVAVIFFVVTSGGPS
jgi:hypothetical protein